MWWMRRPAHDGRSACTLCQCWLALLRGKAVTVGGQRIAGAGIAGDGREPALFMLIDWLRWRAVTGVSLAQSSD